MNNDNTYEKIDEKEMERIVDLLNEAGNKGFSVPTDLYLESLKNRKNTHLAGEGYLKGSRIKKYLK